MYRNLEAELKRAGVTKAALAKALNIAPSTMSAKFAGASLFTIKDAKQIKELLGVGIPLEELFANEKETA